MSKKRFFLSALAASIAWKLLRRFTRKSTSTQVMTRTNQVAQRAPHAQRAGGSMPLRLGGLLGFIAVGLRSRSGRVSVVIFGGVLTQSTYAAPVNVGPQAHGPSVVALLDGPAR